MKKNDNDMGAYTFLEKDIKKHLNTMKEKGDDHLYAMVGTTPILITKIGTPLFEKHKNHLLQFTVDDIYVVFDGIKKPD